MYFFISPAGDSSCTASHCLVPLDLLSSPCVKTLGPCSSLWKCQQHCQVLPSPQKCFLCTGPIQFPSSLRTFSVPSHTCSFPLWSRQPSTGWLSKCLSLLSSRLTWIKVAIRSSNPFPYPGRIPGAIQRSVDRNGDVNGGADGQEDHGGKVEGSELLIGFDTLGFGIPNGKAGKVGAKAQGRDQRLGSEQPQHRSWTCICCCVSLAPEIKL